MEPEALSTERLILREPRPVDAAAIFRTYASDPEVARYMTWRPHSSISETERFLSEIIEAWKQQRDWVWLIEPREGGSVMGAIGIRRDRHQISLGYALGKAHWGRGYMPEAARAVMERAFADPTIFRVFAMCDVDNRASARVMEKIGMRREGLLRSTLLHPNLSAVPRDGFSYSKVRTEALPSPPVIRHTASVAWERGTAVFTDNRYSREHRWRFDGGAELVAAASPHAVPPALTNPAAVDPEEAFVASLSSCHMLWFLSLAAKAGFMVDRYIDAPEGLMTEDGEGRRSITRVILKPRVDFSREKNPSPEARRALHEAAHAECFLARSVRATVELDLG